MGVRLPVIRTADNDIKERISVGLVALIAARAGCQVGGWDLDRTARDIHISPVDGEIVQIDAQLKSTTNLIDAGHVMKFDLPVSNYDRLRATLVANAQILIVVDLHGASVNWLTASADELIFRKCAYWVSLFGAPATTNQTTIRIDIPKVQVFSPTALEEIMTRRFERIKEHHGGL